jgi:hypothetical protein
MTKNNENILNLKKMYSAPVIVVNKTEFTRF